MKKYLVLVVFIVSFGHTLLAQVGERFPNLTGTNLNDKTVTLPQASQGKPALMVLAYSKKSQDDLETWVRPVYKQFIASTGEGLFSELADDYDINVYFVPMIKGINKAAYGKVEKEMRANTDKVFKPHVVLYKGSLSPYKKVLSLNSKDEPYLYLVNQQGKIVYATSGAYSSSKMGALEDELEKCYK
ncbi:MAG: hypothetical protein AAF734_04180 [Bacteroidota bacterium]